MSPAGWFQVSPCSPLPAPSSLQAWGIMTQLGLLTPLGWQGLPSTEYSEPGDGVRSWEGRSPSSALSFALISTGTFHLPSHIYEAEPAETPWEMLARSVQKTCARGHKHAGLCTQQARPGSASRSCDICGHGRQSGGPLAHFTQKGTPSVCIGGPLACSGVPSPPPRSPAPHLTPPFGSCCQTTFMSPFPSSNSGCLVAPTVSARLWSVWPQSSPVR